MFTAHTIFNKFTTLNCLITLQLKCIIHGKIKLSLHFTSTDNYTSTFHFYL